MANKNFSKMFQNIILLYTPEIIAQLLVLLKKECSFEKASPTKVKSILMTVFNISKHEK